MKQFAFDKSLGDLLSEVHLEKLGTVFARGHSFHDRGVLYRSHLAYLHKESLVNLWFEHFVSQKFRFYATVLVFYSTCVVRTNQCLLNRENLNTMHFVSQILDLLCRYSLYKCMYSSHTFT